MSETMFFYVFKKNYSDSAQEFLQVQRNFPRFDLKVFVNLNILTILHLLFIKILSLLHWL